ncbi:unnamed protein product [Malus baccata var. baccata]
MALCIQYPVATQGKTDAFELKSILLHHIPKYHGLSMEDLNKHLKEFEVVCLSMTPINVDGNILKIKAFPFSLLEKAKDWLYELAPRTVTYWESMKQAFLETFFPTLRVILLRKRISVIQQSHRESFPAYYECFKTLVASCLQHQMKEELLLQYFYEGLLPIERQMLDASEKGALVDKTSVAAKILIANRALNAQQYEGVGQKDIPRQQVHKGLQSQNNRITNQDKEMSDMKKQISSIVMNPKGDFETVKAITLRSGKELGNHPKPSKQGLNEDEKMLQEEEQEARATAREDQPLQQPPKASKLFQTTKYAKFLKELCTTRKRISNKEVVQLGELKNDGMIIQLADRSNAYPKGVLEEVLVQVNNLIFPADFYVLDMEDSAHPTPLPFLLGRPFMKITRTKIDVFKGTLTMEFDGEIIDFNISEAIKYPQDDHSCFSTDVFDLLVQDYLDLLDKDPLETTIAEGLGL